MTMQKCYDVAVIGASLGGLRAAIAAASRGMRVVLTEETDWVGGQLTAQGVPPDEHWQIDIQGGTASYRAFRNRVRDHYRNDPGYDPKYKDIACFNPGDSLCSDCAHEPNVGHDILCAELAPYLADGRITLMLETVPVSAEVEGDEIRAVTVRGADGAETVLAAKMFLDGTDLGDLLPLVGAEYRVGAESRAETGEPDAPEVACPGDLQPVTWVFALEMMDELDEADRIPKPERYDHYANMKASYRGADHLIFSWNCIAIKKEGSRVLRMFMDETPGVRFGLWEYRRVRAQSRYTVKVNELSLINWPQQDYMFGSIFDSPDADEHRAEAKQFSLCLAYWIQNEAPRVDGGFGYPVRLAKGVLGTDDGFAKYPYIREGRRLVTKKTILEQEVWKGEGDRLTVYPDSVGTGFYALDFHETLVTHCSFSARTNPFEIPLGALIPVRMRNLLPACKNIGTTHITNACYRLHPIEWNVGESAGYLAAFCLARGLTPAEVYADRGLVEEYQRVLADAGVGLHWDMARL